MIAIRDKVSQQDWDKIREVLMNTLKGKTTTDWFNVPQLMEEIGIRFKNTLGMTDQKRWSLDCEIYDAISKMLEDWNWHTNHRKGHDRDYVRLDTSRFPNTDKVAVVDGKVWPGRGSFPGRWSAHVLDLESYRRRRMELT